MCGEACLAVGRTKLEGLRPSFGLWPKELGHSPDQGLSPRFLTSVTGEASLAAHQAAQPRHEDPLRAKPGTADHAEYSEPSG